MKGNVQRVAKKKAENSSIRKATGRSRKNKPELRNLSVYLTREQREKIDRRCEEVGIASASALVKMVLKKEGII